MKLRNKKTGKVVIARKIGFERYSFDEYTYNSLANLNEEWEDYEPAEPLIKDEKVRKAVRAWGYSPLKFHRHSRKGYATFQICSKYICFNELFEGLKDGNSYTIAELCGEEEE